MSTIRKLGEESKLGTYGNKNRTEKDYDIISTERPPGVLAIWLQLLLMYLPIVGWGFTLYFSVSNSGTGIRKNLARATIINKIILLLVASMIYFAISSMLSEVTETLNTLLEEFDATYTNTQSIVNTLEKIISYINKLILN